MTVRHSSTQAASLPEGCCPARSRCATYGRCSASGQGAAYIWSLYHFLDPNLGPTRELESFFRPRFKPNRGVVSHFGPKSLPNLEHVSLFGPNFGPKLDVCITFWIIFGPKSGAYFTFCAQIRAKICSLCHFLCSNLWSKSDPISQNRAKFGPKKWHKIKNGFNFGHKR